MSMDLNAVKMIEESLRAHLADAISDKIVYDTIKELEGKIRDLVKAEAEKIIVTGVTKMMSFDAFRDDLNVYVQWKEEVKKKDGEDKKSMQ